MPRDTHVANYGPHSTRSDRLMAMARTAGQAARFAVHTGRESQVGIVGVATHHHRTAAILATTAVLLLLAVTTLVLLRDAKNEK